MLKSVINFMAVIGGNMFEVSEKASEMIKEFLKSQEEPHTIRIHVHAGCGGPALGMALDDSQESDLKFTEKGIDFVIEKELYEDVKPIHVDFIETATGSGFKLTSNLPVGEGCGGGCCC
jgi:iron-sulfur cluster assembly accessory protein